MWIPLLVVVVIGSLLHFTEAQHPCDSITGNYDTWLTSAQRVDVVVVGGGASGLSAAKVLLKDSTADVVVLEAQDYLGGRVKTHRQGDILVEDGAEWVNGGVANRLFGLAKRLNALTNPIPASAYDWRARTWDGTVADARGYDAAARLFEKCEEPGIQVNYYTTGYGKCYIDRFDKVYKNSRAVAREKAGWYHYLHMWVNKDVGCTDWMEQSARDADRFTDWGYDRWNQWKDGYDTVITHITKSVPDNKIRTSTPVCKILWDQPGGEDVVLVVTQGGDAYLASHVIFTASIGHLKDRHTHLFEPQLPQSYRDAMNGIELGIANKVQLGWSYPWWGPDPLNLHIIFPKMELPPHKSWLYGLMEILTIHQQPNMLQGFIPGDYGIALENLPEATVKEHIVQHLKDVTGQNVPEPTFFRRSRWMANPWTRGSYNSFVTVEGDKAGLRNRNPLTRPLVNSNQKKMLYWAGEHLSNTRYGTVDGAMDTGETQAYRLIDANPKYWK
ncbi:hypothetical protein Pcinc_004958 [Petrolisthes cinctipes]|uniref:Amine oxidase n=2 Tax=Petrolisthes cinctipes TaxID=88211 RepID=A0AAE1GG89_PETCI|nr:hypothetical protein Pcinc_004958 [Petrolisthes cinctipes]